MHRKRAGGQFEFAHYLFNRPVYSPVWTKGLIIQLPYSPSLLSTSKSQRDAGHVMLCASIYDSTRCRFSEGGRLIDRLRRLLWKAGLDDPSRSRGTLSDSTLEVRGGPRSRSETKAQTLLEESLMASRSSSYWALLITTTSEASGGQAAGVNGGLSDAMPVAASWC